MSERTAKRHSAPTTTRSTVGVHEGRNRRWRSTSCVASSLTPHRAVGLFERWSTEHGDDVSGVAPGRFPSTAAATMTASDSLVPLAPNPRRQRQRVVAVVLGDAAVGKTSLIEQLGSCYCSYDKIAKNYDFCCLIDATDVEITFIEKHLHELEFVLDQELHTALFMYDVTNFTSFRSLSEALILYSKSHLQSIPTFLVANKVDLQRHRLVQEAGRRLQAVQLA